MLAEKTYPQDYIDGCRARMDAQLAAYRELVSSTANAKAVRAALDSFEPLFFNHLVSRSTRTSCTARGPSKARTATL